MTEGSEQPGDRKGELATIGDRARPSSPGRTIVVNGRNCLVAADDVSHDQLVRLAYPALEREAGRSFTVTYRRGPVQAAEGILVSRQRTPIIDGEAFNVTLTDKS